MGPVMIALLLMGLPAGVGLYAIIHAEHADDRQFGGFLLVYALGIAFVSYFVRPRFRPLEDTGNIPHVPIILLICLSVGATIALWKRLHK
ncbi:MAG: hypothetical protein ABJO67_01030 [Pseudoruegeria sp.]